MKWMIFVELFFISTIAFTQEKKDSAFCVPGIIGQPRTKGIIVRQENVLNYKIKAESKTDRFTNGEAEVNRNRRWEFKVRAPIWNNPGLKLAIGLGYRDEEYTFENPASLTYPLYKNLEDKSLKTINTNFYVVKPFRSNKYLSIRFGFDLASDTYVGQKFKSARYSMAPVYNIQKSKYETWGFGLAYGYNLGRPVISPILLYNRTYNEHWGLELLLPTKVKGRYYINEKTLLLAALELDGATYNVHLEGPDFENAQTLYLQRSELRNLLIFEREIHDWLWFSAEAGLRYNINFRLSESFKNREHLINNKIAPTSIFAVTIFAVPPRKFSDR